MIEPPILKYFLRRGCFFGAVLIMIAESILPSILSSASSFFGFSTSHRWRCCDWQ
jgi:hypothetical protein